MHTCHETSVHDNFFRLLRKFCLQNLAWFIRMKRKWNENFPSRQSEKSSQLILHSNTMDRESPDYCPHRQADLSLSCPHILVFDHLGYYLGKQSMTDILTLLLTYWCDYHSDLQPKTWVKLSAWACSSEWAPHRLWQVEMAFRLFNTM